MNHQGKILFPAFSENNIAIVLFGNNFYLPYMGVLVQSIIDHASGDKNYDIIILERDILESNKNLMRIIIKPYGNFSVRFFDPTYVFASHDISFFEKDSVYPLELYYKVLAPYVLENYAKIVALDSDTLVKRDIADLYELDLSDASVGSTLNIVFRSYMLNNRLLKKDGRSVVPAREYCRDFLPMKDPYRYINGGVLIINCERYRAYINLENFLKALESKPFLAPELDPLNLVFEEEIKIIDSAWNTWLLLNPHLERVLLEASNEDRQRYLKSRENPFMLHWAGRPKPWVCPDVEYGYEWWETAKRTPFMGHIIVRMVDALEKRREYYRARYGKEVSVWNPVPPEINR